MNRQDETRPWQDKGINRQDRQDKTRQDKTNSRYIWFAGCFLKSWFQLLVLDKVKTRQNRTRHDKTKQDKIRQDKTRQDKTRQDKTTHGNNRTRTSREDPDKSRRDEAEPKPACTTVHRMRWAPDWWVKSDRYQDKKRQPQDKTRQPQTRQDEKWQDKTWEDNQKVTTR